MNETTSLSIALQWRAKNEIVDRVWNQMLPSERSSQLGQAQALLRLSGSCIPQTTDEEVMPGGFSTLGLDHLIQRLHLSEVEDSVRHTIAAPTVRALKAAEQSEVEILLYKQDVSGSKADDELSWRWQTYNRVFMRGKGAVTLLLEAPNNALHLLSAAARDIKTAYIGTLNGALGLFLSPTYCTAFQGRFGDVAGEGYDYCEPNQSFEDALFSQALKDRLGEGVDGVEDFIVFNSRLPAPEDNEVHALAFVSLEFVRAKGASAAAAVVEANRQIGYVLSEYAERLESSHAN